MEPTNLEQTNLNAKEPEVLSQEPTTDKPEEKKALLEEYGTGITPVAKPIQSPNFKTDDTGWRFNSNGDVETNGSKVTSTHFKRTHKEFGVSFWVSDGTTPNGALSGTAGDICYNGDNNQAYRCTGGTVWTLLGGSSFDPTTTFEFYEDFLGGNNTSETIGTNGWTYRTGSGGADLHTGPDGSVGHPGIFTVGKTGNNENGAIYVAKTTDTRTDQPNLTMIAGIQLSTLSAIYCRVGIIKDPIQDGDTGHFFEYDSSVDGNWHGVGQNGASRTVIGTIAATTNWVQLKMVINASYTQVDFYVDGVLLGSQSTTLPTQKAYPFFQVGCRSGLARSADIDYYHMTITGLTR